MTLIIPSRTEIKKKINLVIPSKSGLVDKTQQAKDLMSGMIKTGQATTTPIKSLPTTIPTPPQGILSNILPAIGEMITHPIKTIKQSVDVLKGAREAVIKTLEPTPEDIAYAQQHKGITKQGQLLIKNPLSKTGYTYADPLAVGVVKDVSKNIAKKSLESLKDTVYNGLKALSKKSQEFIQGGKINLENFDEVGKLIKILEKETKPNQATINQGLELLKLHGTDITNPVNKIINALKEAKPLRGQQEAIYTAERSQKMAKALSVGEKTTGEAGFKAELGQLKGEMPKVQFESIRGKIGQEDIDTLFNQVKDSQVLNFWNKITARQGLAKMFEGGVPTEGELKLLGRVFPKEFIETVLGKRDSFTKMAEAGYQLANIPRSVMASVDLSAPFRQGLFLISHPKKFFGSFLNMFKSFGSEKAFKATQEAIVKKPTFDLMQDSKLALTEMDNILTLREERFMSNWAEKIPVVGKVIRASGRAYTGFLNKLRADVFEDLITKADNLGLTPRSNPDLVKEIANFVNIASGRGSLGKLQPAATALNSFFFSPRLMASRLTLLNPVYYVKADPFVRKEALKSLLTVAGGLTTILGLSKLAGAEVEIDPRSSDFAKIKIGNTRIDLAGGTQQYVRMAAQLITGKYVSSTTGKEITLGEGYKPLTRMDILLRQVEAKEAPIFSFLTDLMRGQDYAGQPINITNEVASRFYPMAIGDIVDISKDDPTLLPISVLGIFGVGVQTYQTTKTTSIPGQKSLNEIFGTQKMSNVKTLQQIFKP